ncbi:hypothetical protein [Streptomyces sp. NPDC002588]|uniref:hypothetical protein n=1 Tax=Streptomyces sp. NPDC002588 TaxID=3154419 RepID=UPI0033239B2C
MSVSLRCGRPGRTEAGAWDRPPSPGRHHGRPYRPGDNQPLMGWLSRVTGLLRRNGPGDEPASSPPVSDGKRRLAL